MITGLLDKRITINNTARAWAYTIGAGLALYPIHNEWLTELATNDKGEVGIFLPALGAVIWIVATLFYVMCNWKALDFGPKKVLAVLAVIVLSMGISGFLTADSIGEKFAPLLLGICLTLLYVVSRTIGADIFKAFIPATIIVIISVVIAGIITPGVSTGGLISNYCASAGYIFFGVLACQGKWQWALVLAALIGIFFIGALESLIILGALGITLLVRRDFSKKLLVCFIVLTGLVSAWAVTGNLTKLYTGNENLSALSRIVRGNTPLNDDTLDDVLTDRWGIYVDSLSDIKMLGHGFSLNVLPEISIVHNMPLIIMYQLGPLAALAWMFLIGYCLVKTRWKYLWIAIIAMSIFDHYLWTQFMPLLWVATGVSLTSTVKSDLIFRKGHYDKSSVG